jgi:hypothetical protein
MAARRGETRSRDAKQDDVHAVVSALEQLVAERRSTAPRHSGRLLGSLLVARGYLVSSELDIALARQQGTGLRLGEILIGLGLVEEHVVAELLAEQLKIDVFDPARMRALPEIGRRLPEQDCWRLQAIPLRARTSAIEVVVVDPTRPNLIAELMGLLGTPVRLCVSTKTVVAGLIESAHNERSASDARVLR